ncbi:MAG: zinc metallopeptidase [Opitutales bacterium]|nr:zinc metallopeptidase [Opitutales bacterium]MBO5254590.1 zinc metallopeptidase [Opitutales bacterium]MBQ2721394.1 zinc metallopeptidase [Opitutales bacterium]MBR7106372.1 zinc metallopeptidase [Opitutales bacterium]
MTFLVLILVPIFIGMYAQMKVSSAYEKYSRIGSRSGITGRDAAQAVMRSAGINDVQIIQIDGHLTDHYDPTKKVLALSRENYAGTSLSALGVSAHEAGHAIQHAQKYAPLNLRMSLVPITNFACSLLPIVMLGGFFLFNNLMTIYIGIGIYLILTIFQLVTLPVEFNASTRAKMHLRELGLIEGQETRGVAEVLDAAAFTYVAAFVSSLGWLLYLLSMANDRR